jgi:hypothetical protein
MTSKNITRNDFLRISAGFVGVSLGMGCPADDTGDDGSNASSTGTDPTAGGSTSSSDDTPGTTIQDPDSSSSGMPPGTDSSSSGMPPGTDSSSGETTAGVGCDVEPTVEIGTNHGHELEVPLADVMAAVEVTYDIQGTSMHPHSVTLTVDDFMMLQQGMQVIVESTAGGMGHTHQVTVSCGA